MKKFFMTMIAILMVSFACVAKESVSCKIVRGEEISVVNKDNAKYSFDPKAYLIISVDDNDFKFTAYDVVEKEGKSFIYGKGDCGCNVICVEDSTVKIILPRTRQFVINSQKTAEDILDIVNNH